MRKGKRLFWLLAILAVVLIAYAYAGEVKLTTYYPAPYGEYKRIISRTVGVGDTSGDGNFNSSDAPDPATNPGDVWVKGNVGIGTTTPVGPLHVVGADNAASNTIFMPGGGTGTMRLGIGTENPESTLTVTGGVDQPMAFFRGRRLRPPSNPSPDPSSYIFLRDMDSNAQWGQRVGDAGDFGIHLEGTGDYLTILNNGNVGIGFVNVGADAPDSLLHLVGAGRMIALQRRNNQNQTLDILFYAHAAAPGDYDWDISYRGRNEGDALRVYAGGGIKNWEWQKDGSAWMRGALTQNSDIRLKADIHPIPDALERICRIRGVNFHWKDAKGYDPRMQMGVIGQEVEKVFPELVSTDSEGQKAVAYTQITAALIEAVKELKAENESLRRKVDSLKKP